jgi:PQQ-dependent catabolism-associated beta-propeller protein
MLTNDPGFSCLCKAMANSSRPDVRCSELTAGSFSAARGRLWLALAGALLLGSIAAPPAWSERSGLVIVSNEKSNTLSILDGSDKVIKTVETCARPRGMRFSANRQQLYVGCGDDDTIAIYDLATFKLVKRYREIPDPETFDLHPNGRDLYISNEDDSQLTVLDIESGEVKARYETGAEPEGVLITPDGKLAFVASEAANLVHVIDIAAKKIVKSILVGTRPRRFALRPDGNELWVSAELSGEVNIIDLAKLEVTGTIVFAPPAIRRDQVTPVDLLITKDGKSAYVALGRANRVAVVDVTDRRVREFILVGKRPWGLQLTRDEKRLYVTNGLSDELSIIEVPSHRVLKSVPVGIIPYAVLIDD